MNLSDSYDSDFLFFFEKGYNYPDLKQFLDNNWRWWFGIPAIYLTVVFGLKKYMENRPRMQFKYLLAIWNFSLAFYSISSALRCGPFFISFLYYHGFHNFVCDFESQTRPALVFWWRAFILMRIVEMFDTIFIVLRKSELIFLHWYHHITVLWFCIYNTTSKAGTNRYNGFLNAIAHSLMYSYYFLKVLGYKVPKYVSMSITFVQLFQFFGGLFVVFWSLDSLNKGLPCSNTYEAIALSIAMYGSYFVLFCIFFYNAYFGKPKDKVKKK